jgi:hypothetical protein
VKGIFRLALVPLGAIAIALVVGSLRRDSPAETPGAVVEKFVRHVSADRFGKAAPLLTSDLEKAATPEALSTWERESQTGLGDVRSVRGETDWVSGEEAEATAILESEHRERRLRFALKREDGEWAIARLDGFWGNAPAPADSIRVKESWRSRPAPVRRRR